MKKLFLVVLLSALTITCYAADNKEDLGQQDEQNCSSCSQSEDAVSDPDENADDNEKPESKDFTPDNPDGADDCAGAPKGKP